jgi:WD40 repeat protein
MAPEQAQASRQPVGPAADIYALGAILYELLTGRPPFKGTSPEETIAQLLFEEPISPALLRPSSPRDLVIICLKCLEKDPRRRYASAGLLALDVQYFLEGKPIRARPVRLPERIWRWCRRRPAVAALGATSALMTVALVVTVVVYQSKLLQQTAGKLENAEQQAEQERRQLSTLDHVLAGRALEDGDAFATLLWLTEALRQDLGHGDQERIDRVGIALTLERCPHLVRTLTVGQEIAGVQVSPLGCWLATIGEDGPITIVEALTGKVRTLPPSPRDQAVPITISRDGQFLALAGTDRATWVWNLKTGRLHAGPLQHDGPIQGSEFSADSRFLSVRVADGSMEVWELGTVRRLLPDAAHPARSRYAAVTDDGRRLFVLADDGVGHLRQLPGNKTTAGALKTERVPVRASLSGAGRLLAVVDPDNALWLHDVPSGKETMLQRPSPGTAIQQLHWNAAGRLLLTVDRQNQTRVWDTASATPLGPPITHGGSILSAGFTENDNVATVSRDGRVQVWQMPANPKDALRLTLQVIKGESGDLAAIPADERSLSDLLDLARALSGRQVNAAGTLEPVASESLRAARRAARLDEENVPLNPDGKTPP